MASLGKTLDYADRGLIHSDRCQHVIVITSQEFHSVTCYVYHHESYTTYIIGSFVWIGTAQQC